MTIFGVSVVYKSGRMKAISQVSAPQCLRGNGVSEPQPTPGGVVKTRFDFNENMRPTSMTQGAMCLSYVLT